MSQSVDHRDAAIPVAQPGEEVAALDLGSNSFHLVVARLHGGELFVLDRLKESVQLAAGLDQRGRLDGAAVERALACLERFGQRVGGIAPHRVRAVGTNTLRVARNAREFLRRGEQVFGHGIEVVSGFEEARLIYTGAVFGLGHMERDRLVTDIGGGSTELIIGRGREPRMMDSMQVGCVSLTRTCFGDGRISGKRMQRARLAALREFEPVARAYREGGWDEAVGASGTIRSVDAVIRSRGLGEGITVDSLAALERELVRAGRVSALRDPELDPQRAAIFPAGVAILRGVVEALDIPRMGVTEGALREGLLLDLAGRREHADVREQTVAALMRRYAVDVAQARRVESTALAAFRQVADAWGLDAYAGQLLRWAACLHEVGLSIAHSRYHRHGAYILENADLAGFSRQEQQLLAILVRCHRRGWRRALFRDLPGDWPVRAARLAVLLRVAVLLHRDRGEAPRPMPRFAANGDRLHLGLGEDYLRRYPLTRADLEEEVHRLRSGRMRLEIR
ncbi:MAG TPA: Ppx/GppA phosphatase family protein [Gammaproteobacteria bacterium]|nr:Ppx/GppA phosphatase family protein [Gammaproteobacteria bacterium]